jgi:hypothetical protein
MFVFMMLLMGTTVPDVEALIAKLNPEVGPATKKMVAETVVEYGPKYGFSTMDDMKLILAVIQTESSFVHKKAAGSSGEWGMMQVIPGDSHIMSAAKNYSCHSSEVDKSLQDEDGKWFKLCNGTTPNFYSRGSVWPARLARFIKHSPRAGIAIGIQEMAYWRDAYDSRLKAKYWTRETSVPSWRSTWWHKVRAGLGERVWICHYNYGNRIKLSIVGHGYPLRIIKFLNMM